MTRFAAIALIVLLALFPAIQPAAGQGMHETLVSLESRRTAAGLPDVHWNRTADGKLPAAGVLDSMGIEARLAILRQAVEDVFPETAQEYMNIRGTELVQDATPGALRPYTLGDFPQYPWVGPENHHEVVASFARDVLSLRVLAWNGGEFEIEESSKTVSIQGALSGADENGNPMWEGDEPENSNAWMPDGPFGADDAEPIEKVVSFGEWTDEFHVVGGHSRLHRPEQENFPEFRSKSSNSGVTYSRATEYRPGQAPGGLAGQFVLLAQDGWTPYSPSLQGVDRMKGAWKVLGVAQAGADISIPSLPSDTVFQGAWVQDHEDFSNLPPLPPEQTVESFTFVPEGFTHIKAWLETAESSHRFKGFDNFFYSNGKFLVHTRSYRALCVPVFTTGLDGISGSGLQNLSLLRGTAPADVVVEPRPRPGTLAGLRLGAGLHDRSTDGYLALTPVVATDYPLRNSSNLIGSGSGYMHSVGYGRAARWDFPALLRVAAPASAYHVVYEAGRDEAAKDMEVPSASLEWDDYSTKGWHGNVGYFMAWETPRLRQIIGHDFIFDFTEPGQDGHQIVIKVYRTSASLRANPPAPGVAAPVSGLTLLKTITWGREQDAPFSDGLAEGPDNIKIVEQAEGAGAPPQRVTTIQSSAMVEEIDDNTSTWTFEAASAAAEVLHREVWEPGEGSPYNSHTVTVTGSGAPATTVTGLSQPWEVQPIFPASVQSDGTSVEYGLATVWPAGQTTLTVEASDSPDTVFTYKEFSRVPVKLTHGPWKDEWQFDGNTLTRLRKHSDKLWTTEWMEWQNSGATVVLARSPDGSVSTRGDPAVHTLTLHRHGPGGSLPWAPASATASGGWSWSATHVFSGGNHTTTIESGHSSRKIRDQFVSNALGIIVSATRELNFGGPWLQVEHTEASSFNQWGAPEGFSMFPGNLSTSISYAGATGIPSSATDPLGTTTSVTSRDAVGRPLAFTWNGATGSITRNQDGKHGTAFALSLVGAPAAGASIQTDGLGRPTRLATLGGNPATLDISHGSTTTEMTAANEWVETTSTLGSTTGALLAASGTTLPFGGTTGNDLEVDVESGLFKSHTEITNRPGIFRTTWTDAWGRVREIHEPGSAGGNDETVITYSQPGEPVQRVLVVDAADRHMLSEYEPSTGIHREGIDVDGNGQLGSGDRFTTTTPTIAGGEIKLVTTITGEGDPLTENTYNPASGATTTKNTGGAATLTSTTNWNTKTSTTTSTDGWSSTSSFNNLGLTTGGSTTGTGIPALSTSRDLRADGSVEQTSLTIGGETTSASFAPNGLLTAYIDPVLGIRTVDHDITGGIETLSIGDEAPASRQTSVTSLDVTSSAISGPNIFAREVSTQTTTSGLQTTIDPEVGASTVLTLNNAGLKTEHGYAAEHKPVITWKPGGLPESIDTGLGDIVFNHSTNGARDLTGITFPSFGFGSGAIGFTYDDAGRIATLGDDTGTRTFTWSFGHPLSEIWDAGPAILRPLDGKRRLQETEVKNGATTLITTTPDYNGDSRELDSISTDGFTATFTRDAATRRITGITRGNVSQSFGRGTGGRITSATSNVTGAPSYSYPSHDAQGRCTAANTNRGNWEYEYRGGENGDGQLHKANHTGNWDFVYNTDGIGRRVSVSNPASNGSLLANDEWDDPLNRFLSTYWLQQRVLRASLDREAEVVITDSNALADTLLPGLTPNPQQPLREIVHALTPPGPGGGWTAWGITGTLEGGGDPGAAPDRKAKLAGLALFPPAEETFTYDDAGNRSSSARWLYTYDGLNRLTRAVNKSLLENDPNNNEAHEPEAWDVEFTYDAEGRRHSKTSKLYRDGALKDTTLTTWIWDGWHPVIERIIDAKLNKPIVERKLVWGPDLSGQPGGAGGAGGLLLIRETNHTFDGRPPATTDLLPLYDGSGNIVGLANPQGDLLAEYWYGPFGELLEATGSHATTNPWRWASKSLDPETGLVYFGLRYYDPATGQWLSREPLGEGESLNLYAYCHNDPINRVDVLGAAEVPFTPALAGLESTEKFKALFARSNFPADAQAWVVWRNLAEGMIDPVSKAYYGESDEEFLVRRGHVREVAADYETTLREIIAGTRAAEDAFKNAVREQEAAIKATPGYWVRTVAGDFRGAGFLLSGIAIDTVTVPLGGARFRPWAHPMDQWQDVSGGERALATFEFVSLPLAFLPTNAGTRFVSIGSHADDAVRMSMAWRRGTTSSGKIVTAGESGAFGARELGLAITRDDFATLAYSRIQKAGFDVHLISQGGNLAGETVNTGVVYLNLMKNSTLREGLATLVHESAHVDLFIRSGRLYGTRGVGEYMARAREFLYLYGRRPNAAERDKLIKLIRSLGYEHR